MPYNRGVDIIKTGPPDFIQVCHILPGKQGARKSNTGHLRNGHDTTNWPTVVTPFLQQVPAVLPGERVAYYIRKKYGDT